MNVIQTLSSHFLDSSCLIPIKVGACPRWIDDFNFLCIVNIIDYPAGKLSYCEVVFRTSKLTEHLTEKMKNRLSYDKHLLKMLLRRVNLLLVARSTN